METNTKDDLEKMSSNDLELILMGIVAFWGDGKLTKAEMTILEKSWESRQNHLDLVDYTDPKDVSLSKKEYILGLFEFLKEEEKKISSEEDIELPEKFKKSNKKKLKNSQLTNRQKVFVILIDDLGNIYDEEHKESKNNKEEKNKVENRKTRMKNFQTILNSLAEADGEISDEEKEMISLMEYESKESQIWVWIVAAIIAVILYRYFER